MVEWRLPDFLPPTIRFHHDPQEYEGEHRDMAMTVSLADIWARLDDVLRAADVLAMTQMKL